MKYRRLLRKRIWIPAAVVAILGIAGVLWACSPTYTDLSQLPSTIVPPSSESFHSPPYYGTRVRFEASAQVAVDRAQRENKLILLLHLSGRFGSSETT